MLKFRFAPVLSPALKYIYFTLFAVLPICLFGQGTQATFGQNRVQYKKIDWQFYTSENFKTYFYMGGQENGKYAAIYAEKILPEIELLMEYKMNARIEILVYNDLSDLNQTNIGIGTEVVNMGGQTQIIQNKMFVYFDGNHANFEQQIRQGIAQIVISHILFGGNFQEVLQNAVLMNLPSWFVLGFTSYVGKNWSSEMDDVLKDAVLSGRFKKIKNLRGEEANFYGHAFWHYVEEKYGKSTVSNLFYVTRNTRSLETGLMFVLSGTMKTILEDFYAYYYKIYAAEKNEKDIPDPANFAKNKFKNHKKYTQLKLSEDGARIAYSSNDRGRWCVFIHDLESNKTKVVAKGGLKTTALKTDFQYPLLAWSPDNKNLAVIYEQKDKLKLLIHDTDTKKSEIRNMSKFQGIHDFSFGENSKSLLISGINRGRSDIYIFQLASTTMQQITNDYFDDINPKWFKTETHSGILFASNRNTDTLSIAQLDSVTLQENFDIYFYDQNKTDNTLTQITYTTHLSETEAQAYNQEYFSFISDENGIQNRHVGFIKNIFLRNDTLYYFRDSTVVNPQWNVESIDDRIDSTKVRAVYKDVGKTFSQTNYVSNIVSEDIKPGVQKFAAYFLIDGAPKFYVDSLPQDVKLFQEDLMPTNYALFRQKVQKVNIKKKQEQIQKVEEKQKQIEEMLSDTTELIDETVLFFQSEFNTAPQNNVRFSKNKDGSVDLAIQNNLSQTNTDASIFKYNRVQPYQLEFSTDYITTQLDNSLIMTRYERFIPGTPSFSNPGLSPTFNLGTGDIFENFKITGGFRFPFDFRDSEYFLSYESLKKRLDKKVTYYRRVERRDFGILEPIPFVDATALIRPIRAKQKTNYAELRLSYPIDVVRSIKNYFAYRNERFVFLNTDQISVNLPTQRDNWLFYRLEYVHDNTVKTGLNLMNGLRFKVFGELHKELDVQKENIGNDIRLKVPNINNTYMGVFGVDVRHYQKIHKEIIWANRFAYGGSFGNQKLLFYLGGVDSWIGANIRTDVPVNQDKNYAFQTVVTNMRGFDQNVRNGNNYAVINSELRIPIFSYLIHSPIRSSFIKNFQIIAFTDVGTAWEGTDPYSRNNPLFTESFGQPPVEVEVDFYRNPLVAGYGFGLRSVLLGYFIRFDLAWGNDSGNVGKPISYFSFSFDF